MCPNSFRRTRRRSWTAVLLIAAVLGAMVAPAGAEPIGTKRTAAADHRQPVAAEQTGRMMLVLDSSGSMKEKVGGTTKIAAAKSALNEVIGGLPDDADVGLRVFGAKVFARSDKGACTDSQQVVPPGTGNRSKLRSAVAKYKPYGETPIPHALREAAKDLGAEGQRSIVLVTDGQSTCKPDPCLVAGELAKQGIDLKIDVVGLKVSGQARNQLRCIAKKGRGKYYDADSAEDIAKTIDRAASRAMRPFQADGKPIKGAATDVDATAIKAGVWSDTMPVGEDAAKWYRYQPTMKGSSLLAGVATPGHGAKSSARIAITNEAGDSCGPGANLSGMIDTGLIGAAARPSIEQPDQDCFNRPLLIQVGRSYLGTKTAPTPFSLKLVEVPRIKNFASLPKKLGISDDVTLQVPKVSGAVRRITGGSSFAEAAATTSGTSYRGTIVPGESQVFRIKVDWGQRLSARVGLPMLDERSRARFSDFVGIGIHNPLQAEASAGFIGADSTTSSLTQPRSLTAGTYPVRWRNGGNLADTAFLAGDHYVVVTAEQKRTGDRRGVEVPFRLDVEVQGKRSGAPEFADGDRIRAGGDSAITGDDAGSGKGSPNSSAGKDSSDGGFAVSVKTVAASALGGVSLIAVLLGLLLLLRRRRT